MLELKLTNQVFTSNQVIGMNLFESVGNTIVKVVCDPPCYLDSVSLENMVCAYMSRFLPEGIEVKTSHCVINLSYGQDLRGRYINTVKFQVYI